MILFKKIHIIKNSNKTVNHKLKIIKNYAEVRHPEIVIVNIG